MRLIAVVFLLAFPRWAFGAELSHDAGAPSASAAPASATTDVKVRDKVIFTYVVARGERSAVVRAKDAQAAIDAQLLHPDQLGDVHFEETNGIGVISIGKTPVITLTPEDAEARGEYPACSPRKTTLRLADAVSSERKRSAIATTVFSVSLLVFSALIAFWLLGRAAELAEKLRTDDGLSRAARRDQARKDRGRQRGRDARRIDDPTHARLSPDPSRDHLLRGSSSRSLFESTRGYTEKPTPASSSRSAALRARLARRQLRACPSPSSPASRSRP